MIQFRKGSDSLQKIASLPKKSLPFPKRKRKKTSLPQKEAKKTSLPQMTCRRAGLSAVLVACRKCWRVYRARAILRTLPNSQHETTVPVLLKHECRDPLLCLNQLRANGLRVEDVPRQFDATSSHSIYTQDKRTRIPLSLFGVASGFESRKPTWAKYNQYPHIELTSTSRWEPNSGCMAERES